MSDLTELSYLPNFLQPNANTIVTGDFVEADVAAIQSAGVEHVINFLADDEMTFDEKAAFESAGIAYTHLPIASEDDLRQVTMMAFDKTLRQYHGKKTLMHCKTGNRVGAAVALRAGWLRGRKMDTALAQGKAHGLTGWEAQVNKRLLVPW